MLVCTAFFIFKCIAYPEISDLYTYILVLFSNDFCMTPVKLLNNPTRRLNVLPILQLYALGMEFMYISIWLAPAQYNEESNQLFENYRHAQGSEHGEH